jgi:hypothetical protein
LPFPSPENVRISKEKLLEKVTGSRKLFGP